MTGWFVTSGYFTNDSVEYVAESFKKAFEKEKIRFVRKKSNELGCFLSESGEVCFDEPMPDFVLFWDKDVTLAKCIEKCGVRVFNKSSVIEICDSKINTVVALSNRNLPMPKTVFSPLVFSNRDETDDVFLKGLLKQLSFPIVVKEACGSFGSQVYLVKNIEQLKEIRKKLLHVPHLYQEFVSSSEGRDERIIVIGKKAVAFMQRKNDKDFRANIELGGKAYFDVPPREFVQVAQKVAEILDADYLGVDLLYDKSGLPLVCEVNSNAYFKGIQSVSDADIAEIYLKHIVSVL